MNTDIEIDLGIDLDFDEPETQIDETAAEPNTPESAQTNVSTSGSNRNSPDTPESNELYFDLETVPDQDRFDLIEEFLDPLPDPYVPCDIADCMEPEELLSATLKEIEDQLQAMNPPLEYLARVAAVEAESKKPRKGISDKITAMEAKMTAYSKAYADRLKLLSTTPEFCSICCFGWAVGGGEVKAAVVNNLDGEKKILEMFWDIAFKADRIVGFNILAFDLPVILARSLILGVEPSRHIDLSPYASNKLVTDIYTRRFGTRGNTDRKRPGKLKSLARLYGVQVPVEDVDGSKVAELMEDEKGRELVAEYCKSDVEITRELARKWMGYFC